MATRHRRPSRRSLPGRSSRSPRWSARAGTANRSPRRPRCRGDRGGHTPGPQPREGDGGNVRAVGSGDPVQRVDRDRRRLARQKVIAIVEICDLGVRRQAGETVPGLGRIQQHVAAADDGAHRRHVIVLDRAAERLGGAFVRADRLEDVTDLRDVQILITGQQTGAGGRAHTLSFVGQRARAGVPEWAPRPDPSRAPPAPARRDQVVGDPRESRGPARGRRQAPPHVPAGPSHRRFWQDHGCGADDRNPAATERRDDY